MLEEVIDGERQVLLWEKKIELERETQAALEQRAADAEAAAEEVRAEMRAASARRAAPQADEL